MLLIVFEVDFYQSIHIFFVVFEMDLISQKSIHLFFVVFDVDLLSINTQVLVLSLRLNLLSVNTHVLCCL